MDKATNLKKIQILNIDDADINFSVLKILKGPNPIFMLELGSVFVLIAAPTILGVQALDRTKNRVEQKTYCSAIGSFSNFLISAQVGQLTHFFNGKNNFFDCLEGSFIRVPVGNRDLETPTILSGTHQGFLLPRSPARNLFENIEKMFQGQLTSALFPFSKYRAPLCSSANISGDTRGPITDLTIAKYFAKESNIPLIVTDHGCEKNSIHYPILNFVQNKIIIERASEQIYQMLENVHSSIKIQMAF